jgi:hypothetical protein
MSEVSDPYIPNINPPQPPGISFGPVQIGQGAPDNSLGINGDFYFDTDSKITYVKEGGTWNIVSGSTTVTGGGGTVSSAVDPEGVVTADPGTFLWQRVSQTVWIKDTGTGNTGWIFL